MKKLVLILLFLMIFLSILKSQIITGGIQGRILDHEGDPVENVNVIITGTNLIGNRGSVSDEAGMFYFSGLPSGEYSALFDHASFRSKYINAIHVRLGMMVSIGDVRLEILSMENIEVRAQEHEIDFNSTAIKQNISFNKLGGLPLDRNYQNVTKLMPQSNESYFGDGVSIAGATGLENKYYVNGADVTDPIRGRNATFLPYNFIQDVQILNGGYEAEYRGSLGGLINVVTGSGGENISGQIFGYFTNNKFTGTPRPGFRPVPEKFNQYDIGGSIGGPIIPGLLWFFVAYNQMTRSEKVSVNRLGEYDDWQIAHIFSTKFTWKVNDNNQFQISLFGDPIRGDMIEADLGGASVGYNITNSKPFLYKIEQGSIVTTVNGTHIVGRNVLIESNFSWAQFRDLRKGDTTFVGFIFKDDVNKIITGGPAGGWDDQNDQFSLGLKLTHRMDSHLFKMGLEYTSLSYTTDTWMGRLDRPSESIYVETVQRREGTTGQYLFGIFIQDSWSISDKFKLNAGLRWDPQLLEAADGRIVQKFLKNFSPRMGVIYFPGSGELQKISASYGKFYQMLSMYLQQWYHINNASQTVTQWDHDPRLGRTGGYVIWDMDQEIQNEYPEMQGQHSDEFTIGYERKLPFSLKLGFHGIYRILRQGVEDGVDLNSGIAYFGNPGLRPLEGFPRMTREYKALEVTLERFDSGPISLFLTYVLSRTYGNSPGIYNYLWMDDRANATGQFDTPDIAINSTGLLVNDRTHVFKFLGSYSTRLGITIGTSLIWMSGTPLSEYGGHWSGYPVSFLSQRGTAGRMPAIWDINFRVMYVLPKQIAGPLGVRCIIDLFHVGSPRKAVDFDQTHYFGIDEDGNQINPNREYLKPIQFQPPMSVRLGLEFSF